MCPYLLYGEGRRDRKFLEALASVPQFQYHTKGWIPKFDNWHGCSAKNTIEGCRKAFCKYGAKFTICLIDIDDLKHDYPEDWDEQKLKIEQDEVGWLSIVWQYENAEDEYRKVIPDLYNGDKTAKNREAVRRIAEFVNCDLWKRIMEEFERKAEFEKKKQEKDT
ncbi:hypothetical protein JW899_01340 [Candidatus Uhrbacteria bacterium]|nr:hypothetical protein [Candidatus Uhrbacteria bacterium]